MIRRLFARPPKAPLKSTTDIYHSIEKCDPFKYLEDFDNLETKSYLDEERKFTDDYINRNRPAINSIAKGIASFYPRHPLNPLEIKTARYRYGSRMIGTTKIYYRSLIDESRQEVILNTEWITNAGKSLKKLLISPDENMLAYLIGDDSSDRSTMIFKEILAKSEPNLYSPLPKVENVFNFVWQDNKSVLITELDEYLHSSTVYMVQIDDLKKKVIFEEEDQEYFVDVTGTKDDMALIYSSTKNTTRVFSVDENSQVYPILPFAEGLRYQVDIFRDDIYVLESSKVGQEFYLFDQKSGDKRIIFKPDDHAVVKEFVIIDDNIVFNISRNCQSEINVLKDGVSKSVHCPEPISSVELSSFNDDENKILYFTYSSPVVIESQCSLDLNTLEVKTLSQSKPREIGHDIKCRVEFFNSDGETQIPITIMYDEQSFTPGANPCLMMAYGCYGVPLENFFRANHYYLLTKGFVVALVHVRGGGEYSQWHDAGKAHKKATSIIDLYNGCEYLLKNRFANRDLLFGNGNSAGALLLAALANNQPDLFSALVLTSPFLDPLSSMLDKDVPLAKSEIGEWGDPLNDPASFKLLHSLSPYENVRKMRTTVYITAGMADERVFPSQPLKYMAKYRLSQDLDTSQKSFLNLIADRGHFANPDRKLEENSIECHFILSQLKY